MLFLHFHKQNQIKLRRKIASGCSIALKALRLTHTSSVLDAPPPAPASIAVPNPFVAGQAMAKSVLLSCDSDEEDAPPVARESIYACSQYFVTPAAIAAPLAAPHHVVAPVPPADAFADDGDIEDVDDEEFDDDGEEEEVIDSDDDDFYDNDDDDDDDNDDDDDDDDGAGTSEYPYRAIHLYNPYPVCNSHSLQSLQLLRRFPWPAPRPRPCLSLLRRPPALVTTSIAPPLLTHTALYCLRCRDVAEVGRAHCSDQCAAVPSPFVCLAVVDRHGRQPHVAVV